MKSKKFINGWYSYRETFFEVASHLSDVLGKEPLPELVGNIQNLQGHAGMIDLAEEITDAFEKKNKGRKWHGEFWDEIEKFTYDWCKQKV